MICNKGPFLNSTNLWNLRLVIDNCQFVSAYDNDFRGLLLH